MKKSLFTLLALVALVATASAQQKILTVSMQQCFDGYYKSQKVRDVMDSVRENFEAEVKKRQTDLQAEVEKINAAAQEIRDNPGLSDQAKAEQLQQLQQSAEVQAVNRKQQEFQAWGQEQQQDLQQRATNRRNSLIEEIKKVVMTVGIREGGDLIMDTSDLTGSGVPTVLYASPSFDITNKVLNELNRDQPAE